MFDPFNWFWAADDGRLYSSRAGALVQPTDPSVEAWRADGRHPTRWPEDDAGEQTDAALQAVLEPYGLHVDLAALRSALLARVDEQAEAARTRYITPGSGQAMTYEVKADEARSLFQAGGTVADPVAYPFLTAEIGITGETLIGVAQTVAEARRLWLTAGPQIEAIRLRAKAQIRAAPDAGSARAVLAAIQWPDQVPT